MGQDMKNAFDLPGHYLTGIRRSMHIDVPRISGFKLGERIYFRLVGGEIHLTRTPKIWVDCRYRSARMRRLPRERPLEIDRNALRRPSQVMKRSALCLVRIEPVVCNDARAVLDEGESLSAFVNQCVRSGIAWRRTQDAF